MKNLYHKSKGKIHPSPAPATAANGDALSVLNLLPVAILALTAALAFEDKEVVAYLMLQSLKASSSAATERRRCRTVAGVHRPLFDCGCFDCYTSFWSRWDCSRDREVIHLVIEAFEEHLASKEGGKKGKERRKRRKAKGRTDGVDGENAKPLVVVEAEENKGFEEGVVSVSEGCLAEENKGFEEGVVSVSEGCLAEELEEAVDDEEAEVGSPAVCGERRGGWADVVGLFNSRLWSLWGPAV